MDLSSAGTALAISREIFGLLYTFAPEEAFDLPPEQLDREQTAEQHAHDKLQEVTPSSGVKIRQSDTWG